MRDDPVHPWRGGGTHRPRRWSIGAGALLASLAIASACTDGGERASATSSTVRAEPRPTLATPITTPTTSTSIPPTTTTTTATTTTTTTTTPPTLDRQATARCLDFPNGYRGVPLAFDDPSWTLVRRGEATLVLDGNLVLDAALELWLTRTVDGAREEHHVMLRGQGVATVALDGDIVRILSADTSRLDRRVTSTIDSEPVLTPDGLAGLGDLLGRDFTMRCGVGSGGMGAEALEPSGLRWGWAMSRGGPLRPPDPDA